MSSDATAFAFFGFPLPSLSVDENDLNDKWLEEHMPKKPKNQVNIMTPEWDAWRTKFKKWKTTPRYVEIDFCGWNEVPAHFVHCPCYTVRVDWGIIPLVLRDDPPDAQRWLDAFCDRFNLPKEVAKWHLGARYF